MFKLLVTCVLIALLGLVYVESCDFKDKMCPLPYTKQMQAEILKYHNDVRRQANPTASNMEKMYWDETLAKLALEHSEKCVFKHSTGNELHFSGYKFVGQNLFGSSYKPAAYLPAKAWYGEIKWFTYGKTTNHTVGHYTQVMQGWAARVGCGGAHCPNIGMYMVTCNYLRGQYNYVTPYKLGKPCGACPKSCKNNLCDCGGKVCQRGGSLDLNTCTCKCKSGTKGELCEDNCGGKVCQRGGKLDVNTCKCKCDQNTFGELCEKVNCDIKEKWQCPHYKRAGYCDLRYGYVCRNKCPISCGQC